jgi:hypothetical protein
MRRWAPLNERQLDVLRRAADGTVSSQDWELARTVYALRERKLVETTKGDHRWTARITDGGVFYLAHGHYLDEEQPVTRPARASTRPHEIELDELLSQLKDHDGVLRVTDPEPVLRARWRRVINRAKREGRVPAGFHLRHHGRDGGDLVIELVAGEHPDAERLRNPRERPVVPVESGTLHPSIAGLEDHAELAQISEDSRPRALRLLSALAAEAERRRHRLVLDHDGHAGIWFEMNGQAWRLGISEEMEPVEQLPDPAELGQRRVYAWQRVQPKVVVVGSGRLMIELAEDYSFRGHRRRWADRQRWRLEDKLGEILEELEDRTRLALEREAEAQRVKVERQRRWEEAMAVAQSRLLEDHRRHALLQQVEAFDERRRIDAYCDELEHAASETDHERADELRKWAAWARAHAAARDPLQHDPLMPPDPEPRPDDLRPYLGRWSPYGPEDQRR